MFMNKQKSTDECMVKLSLNGLIDYSFDRAYMNGRETVLRELKNFLPEDKFTEFMKQLELHEKETDALLNINKSKIKYTEKCFLRNVSADVLQRFSNMSLCEGRMGILSWDRDYDVLLVCTPLVANTRFVTTGMEADSLKHLGYIDCGTNADLFLTLCSLRKDSDRGRWFIAAEDPKPHICKCDSIEEDLGTISELYRPMTVLEIIDYYNNK